MAASELYNANFPSFSEGLSLRLNTIWRLLPGVILFPFLFGRAFIEACTRRGIPVRVLTFPFLFGRAFIEAVSGNTKAEERDGHFPSFSEGLSLRHSGLRFATYRVNWKFPFLFGRAFIEAPQPPSWTGSSPSHFPSFSEGLSLRPRCFGPYCGLGHYISLPFRRDFH